MKSLSTFRVVLLLILLPSFCWSTPLDELVERDGLFYTKFSDVPFTGEVTGKSQGNLKNGKKDGDWVSYHDNGQLDEKGNYKNGKKDGDWVSYFDNGQLAAKGNYKNGKADGYRVNYWANGNLLAKGVYKNGEMDGDWVGYWDDGESMELTGTYKDGVKISD
jgi:antitoxin component YwqK of YwqJK toxin-antitoxin module